MSWEGPDPARDEDKPEGLCIRCQLGFCPLVSDASSAVCECRGYGCGCRQLREQNVCARCGRETPVLASPCPECATKEAA